MDKKWAEDWKKVYRDYSRDQKAGLRDRRKMLDELAAQPPVFNVVPVNEEHFAPPTTTRRRLAPEDNIAKRFWEPWGQHDSFSYTKAMSEHCPLFFDPPPNSKADFERLQNFVATLMNNSPRKVEFRTEWKYFLSDLQLERMKTRGKYGPDLWDRTDLLRIDDSNFVRSPRDPLVGELLKPK